MKKNRLLQIVELLEEGYLINEIAKELQLSAGYINNILNSARLIYNCRRSYELIKYKSVIASNYITCK